MARSPRDDFRTIGELLEDSLESLDEAWQTVPSDDDLLRAVVRPGELTMLLNDSPLGVAVLNGVLCESLGIAGRRVFLESASRSARDVSRLLRRALGLRSNDDALRLRSALTPADSLAIPLLKTLEDDEDALLILDGIRADRAPMDAEGMVERWAADLKRWSGAKGVPILFVACPPDTDRLSWQVEGHADRRVRMYVGASGPRLSIDGRSGQRTLNLVYETREIVRAA